jgi:hypothetical protein
MYGCKGDTKHQKKVKMSKNVKRVITVVKESDHKGRFALNECLVTKGSISWTAYWSDETLKMEQLQDKLIAEGANPNTVEEFRQVVYNEAYESGRDTEAMPWG